MILHRYDIIGSTSDEAMRLAAGAGVHGTIVTARQQTAGRGRQGRSWISQPGNLLVSFLYRTSFFPGFTPIRAAELGFVAALAVADTIDSVAKGCRLKWPNDVLLDGGKVAGILTEMAADAIVIGIGINVAHSPPDMPYPVTSLSACGVEADVDALLSSLIGCMEDRLAEWISHGFQTTRTAWLSRGPAIGQALTVRSGAGGRNGGFAGLAEDGALLLSTGDGIQRIVAGEVLQGTSVTG